MRKIFLTFFQSYNHTAVFVADAALHEALAYQLTVAADNHLTQFHLAVFQVHVFTEYFRLNGLLELCQLFVAAYDLQLVAREENVFAVRNVQTVLARRMLVI